MAEIVDGYSRMIGLIEWFRLISCVSLMVVVWKLYNIAGSLPTVSQRRTPMPHRGTSSSRQRGTRTPNTHRITTRSGVTKEPSERSIMHWTPSSPSLSRMWVNLIVLCKWSAKLHSTSSKIILKKHAIQFSTKSNNNNKPLWSGCKWLTLTK